MSKGRKPVIKTKVFEIFSSGLSKEEKLEQAIQVVKSHSKSPNSVTPSLINHMYKKWSGGDVLYQPKRRGRNKKEGTVIAQLKAKDYPVWTINDTFYITCDNWNIVPHMKVKNEEGKIVDRRLGYFGTIYGAINELKRNGCVDIPQEILDLCITETPKGIVIE